VIQGLNQKYDNIWRQFRNDSGEVIPGCSILRVTGVATVNDRQMLTVGKPNTYGSQFFHAINDIAEIPVGGYGMCTLGWTAVVNYDSADGTPAYGEAWGPRDATWKAKKNTGGFMVVGNPDTTNFLVEVQKLPMLSFIGKTDSSHAKGATGTISIYTGTLGAETDTTVNMTGVYNRFAALSSGKWVRCEWDSWNRGWEIVTGEC